MQLASALCAIIHLFQNIQKQSKIRPDIIYFYNFQLFQVSATDKDGVSTGIVYSLKSASDNGLELFQIDEMSGEITISNDGLDADVISMYTLFVEAQDTKLEVPRYVCLIINVCLMNSY